MEKKLPSSTAFTQIKLSEWEKNKIAQADARGRVPPGMRPLIDEIREKVRNQTEK